MEFGEMTARLTNDGSNGWEVHYKALEMQADGQSIIVASIGEPEISPNPVLTQTCIDALHAGRTGYSKGQGETGLLDAIAKRYTDRRGARITRRNVLAVPGTQTALFIAMGTLLSPRDEVLVGDPYYVTYKNVVHATGGKFVPVPLRPDKGFRLQASDLKAAITPASKIILLTTPHNPTGAVLSAEDIKAIGEIATEHDLWIVSDEVYEDLIFNGIFSSPLDFEDLRKRSVVVSSISKSHAAPGFRSGWIVASEQVISQALPLCEAILFGNQPFIADATEAALRQPNPSAAEMRDSYQRRAQILSNALSSANLVAVQMPDAGMFVMVDIRKSGLSGETFAWRLLESQGVSVLPGEAFGEQGTGLVRVSLTITDAEIERVARAICAELRKIVP